MTMTVTDGRLLDAARQMHEAYPERSVADHEFMLRMIPRTWGAHARPITAIKRIAVNDIESGSHIRPCSPGGYEDYFADVDEVARMLAPVDIPALHSHQEAA